MKNYDFIATHKPANITARKVIQKGVNYEYEIHQFHSDLPLPVIKNLKHLLKNPEFKDYTGIKHGTFIVIGYCKFNKKHRWLVKCQCGKYEVRTIKALKNHIKNNNCFDQDTCSGCEDLKKIRIMSTAKSCGYKYEDYCEKFLPRH